MCSLNLKAPPSHTYTYHLKITNFTEFLITFQILWITYFSSTSFCRLRIPRITGLWIWETWVINMMIKQVSVGPVMWTSLLTSWLLPIHNQGIEPPTRQADLIEWAVIDTHLSWNDDKDLIDWGFLEPQLTIPWDDRPRFTLELRYHTDIHTNYHQL